MFDTISLEQNEFGFMRYSASDFWKNSKVDFRDSGRAFKNKVVSFSTSMLVDTCSDSFQDPTSICFEVRDSQSSNQCSILTQFEAFLLNDNFVNALKLLENFAPQSVVNGSMLSLMLIKLSVFESVIKEDKLSVLKCLRELRILLSSFEMCYHKIEVIAAAPELLRSRYYLSKKKEVAQRLVNILNYELIGADMFFLPATQEPVLKYEKINQETSLLQNFEDELLFLAASFSMANHIVNDFDEFLYNSNLAYDQNDQSSRALIADFISTYELSNLTFIEEPVIQPAKPTKPLFTIEKGFEKEVKSLPAAKQSSTESDESSMKSKETKQKNVKLISLKNVSFKTIKRENIDKKNIRKFKRYVALRMKQNSDCQSEFLNRFSSNLLFPPFTYENHTFKSFNTSYIVWLFSHQELVNLYDEYIDLSLEKMLDFLSLTLDMKDPGELDILKIYLQNMATIFSNLSTDNSSIFQKKSGLKANSNSEASISIENQFMRLSVDNHNVAFNCLPQCTEKDKENFILELFDSYVVDADI